MFSQTIEFLSKTYYLVDFIVFWAFAAVSLFAIGVIIAALARVAEQNGEIKNFRKKKDEKESIDNAFYPSSVNCEKRTDVATDNAEGSLNSKEDEIVGATGIEAKENESVEDETNEIVVETEDETDNLAETEEESSELVETSTDDDIDRVEATETNEEPENEEKNEIIAESERDDEIVSEVEDSESIENEVVEKLTTSDSESVENDDEPNSSESEDIQNVQESSIVEETEKETTETADESKTFETIDNSAEENEPIAEPVVEETKEIVTEKRDLHTEIKDGFVYFDAYSRSFISKLIQADKQVQDFYTQIKNKLLSYRKIHDRLSWRGESYRLGRKLEAYLSFRGRTLCMYVALNPDDYNQNVYHQRNYGDRKRYASVPMMVKVRSGLGLKRALTLIDILLEGIAANKKFERNDYYYEYLDDQALLKDGLIKLIRMRRPVELGENESQEEAIRRVITELEQQPEIEAVDDDANPEFEESIENDESIEPPEFEQTDELVEEPVAPAPTFEENESETKDDTEEIPDKIETVTEVESEESERSSEDAVPSFEENEEEEEYDETPAFEPIEKPIEEEPLVPAPTFEENESEAKDDIEEIPDKIETVTEVEIEESERPSEDAVPAFEENEKEKEYDETPIFEPIDEPIEEEPVAPAPTFEESESEAKDDSSELPEFFTPVSEPSAEEKILPEFEEKTDEERESAIPKFESLDEIEDSEIKEKPATKRAAAPQFEEKDNAISAKRKSDSDFIPDELESLPEIKTEKVKEDKSSTYREKQPERVFEGSSALPKGLYDYVPENKKPKKEEKVEVEEKIEIPEGLTDEEKRKIAEDEELLKQLMEEDSSADDEEQFEIVGTCTDTSGFNAFENKIFNASNTVKYYYSELKNTLLSYKKIKCKQSNAGDSFRQGNNLVARITYNGNKLRLHLALNPKDYNVNDYNHYSMINVNAYKDVPFTLEIAGRRDLIAAAKLIQDAMGNKFVVYLDKKREYFDYAAYYTKKED